jgi:hypothetical protein
MRLLVMATAALTLMVLAIEAETLPDAAPVPAIAAPLAMADAGAAAHAVAFKP